MLEEKSICRKPGLVPKYAFQESSQKPLDFIEKCLFRPKIWAWWGLIHFVVRELTVTVLWEKLWWYAFTIAICEYKSAYWSPSKSPIQFYNKPEWRKFTTNFMTVTNSTFSNECFIRATVKRLLELQINNHSRLKPSLLYRLLNCKLLNTRAPSSSRL